ncbi:unnamed protein product [Hyaloperonospora brassicae]|uniref:glucose-6-phosphate 1-epimerase n=1 Tax=Hyaloperonospora brassicae TaxID=162125 RepID=A0AAV0UNC4_HYABA|nr:unnamed protein product [Hyaloperonospora brassicae]
MTSAQPESVIELRHLSGARAEINVYGATVTSFYAATEPDRNVLFVSKLARLDGSKPIRGGIPPRVPRVRRGRWDAESRLCPSDETKKMYPYDVTLVYKVQLLATELVTALSVQNRSAHEIAFHALLHTYLAVDDVRCGRVRVERLGGVRYFDKVRPADDGNKVEQTDALTIDQETDRIYADAPSSIVVRMQRGGDTSQQVVTIDKMACLSKSSTPTDAVAQKSDVVVWNPWVDKAKSMSDFGDDEYVTMLCVEPGRVSEQQPLAAGYTYTLQQKIRLSAL